MKIISAQKEYIDYQGRKFGVRVRNAECRAVRIADNGAAEEYGAPEVLPVDVRALELPSAQARVGWVSTIAQGVRDYEHCTAGKSCEIQSELRSLLLGRLGFHDSVLMGDN